jgi:hypothetical protein
MAGDLSSSSVGSRISFKLSINSAIDTEGFDMMSGWKFGFALVLLVGCTHTLTSQLQREPSGKTDDRSELIYATFDQQNQSHIESTFNQDHWNSANDGQKYDFLMKMYYSNTRSESQSHQKHVGCFTGNAVTLVGLLQRFQFVQSPGHSLTVNAAGATTDQSNLILDITFENNSASRSARFPIPNCLEGKRPILDLASREVSFIHSSSRIPAEAAPTAVGSANINDIFVPIDSPSKVSEEKIKKLKLPKFELKTDYPKAHAVKEELPWQDKGFDLKNPQDAIRFSLMLQKYVYEGMANQNPKQADQNFIASQSKRYWCHIPGLNFGPTGRDAVHGLTKEFNLGPSPTMSFYKQPIPGTDWGMAVYNFKGCQTIDRVVENLKHDRSMEPTKIAFEDGTLTAKILFTTSPDKAFEKAFTWNGHVSAVGETSRSIQPVRHIQMDIAVRDRTLKGVDPEMNNWVMLTYYFDANYDYKKYAQSTLGEANPLESLKGLPEGFLKMRPMGIQTGLGAPRPVTDEKTKKFAWLEGESIIFAGAETNGFEGRMNGPADNPKSACMSCHATAGTLVRMTPGMLSNQEFFPHRSTSLDFSQQLNFLRRNVETYIGPVKR